MEGDITCQSVKGAGSKFMVEVPSSICEDVEEIRNNLATENTGEISHTMNFQEESVILEFDEKFDIHVLEDKDYELQKLTECLKKLKMDFDIFRPPQKYPKFRNDISHKVIIATKHSWNSIKRYHGDLELHLQQENSKVMKICILRRMDTLKHREAESFDFLLNFPFN
jgi:hypothetical protein